MYKRKKFEEGPVTSFYLECVKYLLTNLPLDKEVLIDVKYLHHNMKSKAGASNGLARLTETAWKCFGTSAHEFFEVKINSSVSELKDQVKLELTAFQLEANVPEIYYKDDANTKNSGSSHSTKSVYMLWLESKINLSRSTNIEILTNSGLTSRTALQTPRSMPS